MFNSSLIALSCFTIFLLFILGVVVFIFTYMLPLLPVFTSGNPYPPTLNTVPELVAGGIFMLNLLPSNVVKSILHRPGKGQRAAREGVREGVPPEAAGGDGQRGGVQGGREAVQGVLSQDGRRGRGRLPRGPLHHHVPRGPGGGIRHLLRQELRGGADGGGDIGADETVGALAS